MDASAATLIREARVRAGLTQADLAARASVTQSVVSAYENGRREPSFDTLRRLVAATGQHLESRIVPDGGSRMRDVVRAAAPELKRQLGELGAADLRLFGSVARGEDTAASDVDLLVDLAPGTGLFALLRMQSTAESILGRPVDVVPADSLKPDVAENVLREAIPL